MINRTSITSLNPELILNMGNLFTCWSSQVSMRGPIVDNTSLQKRDLNRKLIDQCEEYGRRFRKVTPLHVALCNSDMPIEVIRQLIQPNTINYICLLGLTPLAIATNFQSIEVIQELLRANADPNIRTSDGESVLDFYIRRQDLPLTVSILEELVPNDFRINIIAVFEEFCLRYMRHRLPEKDMQSMLRFFLLHTQFHYQMRISIQQNDSPNGCRFAILSEPYMSCRSIQWFPASRMEVCEWRCMLMCLIKCGYAITFPPSMQLNSNTYYTQHQQKLEVLKDIKTIYSQYKHQEENEPVRLRDLCCSVVREHIQRPIRAEKYRQLNLPASIVRRLTRENIADEICDEIKECRKSNFHLS